LVEEKKEVPKAELKSAADLKKVEVSWRKMVVETNGKDIRIPVCEMTLLEVKEIGRSLVALQ